MMLEQEEKPKWLLELENRKRKPRLAHEAGAGAPCLSCESACPGLDLHFWRKICKNCKCRGDEHDFDDDEFPQFELLFGPNARKNKKNRSVLLQINDTKNIQEEIPFDWVPPNTTKELASDYMNALPSDKLPIKGSAGAALRKQQLQKQLPLHDIDHKACDGLSDEERKEFEKYLDNLKKCAGQGKVLKLTTIRPFGSSFTTPVNATDVKRFSPQRSQQLLNPTNKLNLRTPSSFIPKGPQPFKKTDLSNEVSAGLEPYECTTLSDKLNTGSIAEATNMPSVCYLKESQISNLNVKENPAHCELKNVKISTSIATNENVSIAPSYLVNKNKSSGAKVCKEKIGKNIGQQIAFSNDVPSSVSHTQCETLLNTIHLNNASENLIKKELPHAHDQLWNQSINKDASLPITSKELDRVGHCSSISSSQDIQRNAEKSKDLKYKCINSDKYDPNMPSQLPYRDYPKELQAELDVSLPVKSNIIHSEILNNPVFPEGAIGTSKQQKAEHIEQLKEQMEGMTMNTTQSYKCHKCEEDIFCGNIAVTAEKMKDAVWHPGCFVCSACNELLVDLVYFTHKEKIYCARDLAKLLKIPRCFACDELIFVKEYTIAEDHNYHVKHFCCWDCDIQLAGQKYISENDRPICLPCYQQNYAKKCDGCNKVIEADQEAVAIKNLNFHALECFYCYICKKNLHGGQLAVKENRLLCSKECIVEFLHKKALGK